jgi:hypothetical protein
MQTKRIYVYTKVAFGEAEPAHLPWLKKQAIPVSRQMMMIIYIRWFFFTEPTDEPSSRKLFWCLFIVLYLLKKTI